MDPFTLKPGKVADCLMDWQQLRPMAYDKHTVDPYTRTRVILMNGTEFEQVWFSHQLSRRCDDDGLRRQLALLRRSEQQQQKLISLLKPADETILEHTIGYEQLAVDLTSALAKCEPDPNVRMALNFALLEDFDHLYRYADLLEMETGEKAEALVGRYTEIMPGRPTISEHRYPFESIKPAITSAADPQTKLCVGIITAAEQQTMNFYMNVCGAYPTELGRQLYQEIGMIEEQHVSQYGSLMDVKATPLECLLMHQYTECYLYWSCMETETDPQIRKIWEQLFAQETAHLHLAAELMERYEGRERAQVIPKGTFPAPLKLCSNIPYVRQVLAGTVQLTGREEGYVCVDELPQNADFFRYQQQVNVNDALVSSHKVIDDHIRAFGRDYRFETSQNPIPPLQDPHVDNVAVGRVPGSVQGCGHDPSALA